MTAYGANRAQALQVGAILLFGFLIIGLALFQTTVVPQQNEGVEFNAYQEAAGDVADLRNGIVTATTRDVTSGTNVRTGATYPSRTVFVNPGPPGTTLRTADERAVVVENVTAVDGEAATTAAYVETISGNETRYGSRPIVFRPDYNEFRAQPMVVTGGSAYRDVGGSLVPLAGQTLIQGNRIDLTMIRGDLDGGGDTVTVTADPKSAATRTVVVENDSTGPIVLRLDPPPGTTADEWIASPVGQSVESNANVQSLTEAGGQIRIELDPDRRYRLRMSLVEVREADDASAVAEPDAEYVVPVSGGTESVQAGGRTELEVEVRDGYNNPVAGEEVTFTADRGEFVVDGTETGTATVTTDSEGRASVVYAATNGSDPIDPGDDTVNASIAVDGDPYETAAIDVSVTSSGVGSATSGDLQILSAEPGGPSGGDTGVVLDVRNAGDQNVTITGIEINKTDNAADRLRETDERNDAGRWDHEVFVNVDDADPDSEDADDGYYEDPDNELSFGTRADFDENALLRAGSSGQIFLFEFRSNPSQEVSMDLSYVKFTVYYTEGGDPQEITVTVFVF